MTTHAMPQRPQRIRGRTVVIPLVSAMALAAVAAYAEVRTVALAWDACDIGSGGGNGFYLIFGALPVLWFAQTALIAVPAPLLARLTRRRLVVTAAMALLATVVVISVAWAFFAWSGLPLIGDACSGRQPTWWPAWVPPYRWYGVQ